jgi:hypothetical protein
MRILRIAIVTVVGAVSSANAQATAQRQLAAKLSPEARTAIQALMDSARVAGLPIAPLADKTYEGVLKGADEHRIVTAVQSLFHRLSDARDILGSAKDPVLLGAVASALQAGVGAADVRRIVGPVDGNASDPHTVAGALITVVDLVAKHVAPSAASASITELLRRHATEQQLVTLRGQVEQDIMDGQSPEVALTLRTTAYVKTLDLSPPPGRMVPKHPPPL